ncbi:hypothetical protein BCR34DRAFT_619205 [Clohesyomyces aquaticus]|uniref:Protein kinase domain-containing protein n=1 Tax=Clohesyomyces aquaticus TaxID=1231657 RepID=A0A1Y1YK36_9PLEO|nr:hypothetical protein BCR34DRAFT_619205 [Clohesyomyces aquaticus]
MPPVIPRKRLRSESPVSKPSPKRAARKPPRHSKESIFQTLDAAPKLSRTLSQTKASLVGADDSELSELESSEEEFEDVEINGTSSKGKGKQKATEVDSDEETEDEDWEDALGGHHHIRPADEPLPEVSGDLEITLNKAAPTALSLRPDGKKGPSKIERHIRNLTHCIHVQFLMFHNLVRNGWVQDRQVQKILVENMTTGCWREIDQYWRNAGIADGPKQVVKGAWASRERDVNKGKWEDSGKSGVKVFASPVKTGAGSKEKGAQKRGSDRSQRDWGFTSDRLEPNTPNLSAGDPLLRLLKYLSAYWKSKFKITAPSLRKRGYLSPATLEAEIGAWRNDPSDADTFGEQIEDLEAFRDMARKCEGSRDVGEQLFTALLRGLGIEARMVVSLQPAGFGWSQAEEGKPKDLEKLKAAGNDKTTQANASAKSTPSKAKGKVKTGGTHDAPIDLSENESSDLSSAISISSDSDIDAKPIKRPPKVRKYGDELPHPTYWTEAISHLTHTPIAVSPLPRSIIAAPSSPDALVNFYARGAAVDKAKQVFAYLIAFSSDGTAKDVTTRYLPKHQWPGKTKGFRMPVEKVPIYNKRGKVKKWEEWDWFKSVLRPYARDIALRRSHDDVEDEGDLVPAKPAKPKDMMEEGGKETLQGYKSSAEYVLERHLRREEALNSGAKIVRHFATGKGENEKKEPVYLRKDVVVCKTVESWHKEGRAVMEGEQPLKYVPMRAVTVTRKREIEEREREEGGKVKQGLYSKAQTDWIIPDPIVDGKIPRNAFGNIDVYVPTMIPRGSVHIPLKGTARICKKLRIDFAEACTGFEFGKQRAVPVLTGVVVAAENEDLVIDAWEAEEVEKARKEQEKKEKLALGLWRKFFTGLRIVERMKAEYGDDAELPDKEPVGTTAAPKMSEWETFQNHQDFEGGFIREEPGHGDQMAGGFMTAGAEDNEHEDPVQDDMPGGFLPASQEDHQAEDTKLTIDHGDQKRMEAHEAATESSHQTPISLQSMLQKPVDESDEAKEEENEDVPPIAPKSKSRTNARGRGRGRGNAKPSRGRQPPPRTSLNRRNDSSDTLELSSDTLELSDPSSSASKSHSEDPSDDDDEDFNAKGRGMQKLAAPTTPRAAPKRKAARQSNANLKSHYFAHGSDEDTDLGLKKAAARGGGGDHTNKLTSPTLLNGTTDHFNNPTPYPLSERSMAGETDSNTQQRSRFAFQQLRSAKRNLRSPVPFPPTAYPSEHRDGSAHPTYAGTIKSSSSFYTARSAGTVRSSSSFYTARSARTVKSSSTFHTVRSAGTVKSSSTYQTAHSGTDSKEHRTSKRLQESSEFHQLLTSKAILPVDPMNEQDWSGRGQYAEFQKRERNRLNEILEVHDTLGSTSTAIVQSVKCRRILLARKTIYCSRRFTKEEAIEEVAHLNRLEHSHIVRVIGTYVMGNELSILLYPVAEYNLEDFFTVCEIADKARSALCRFPHCLVNAVAYIHSKLTKHMDIKPKNILAKRIENGVYQFQVYIADFGISRSYENLDATETEGPTMFTRKYAAPEVVDRDKRGLAADIFSLGCVFLEIFAVLRLPFSASTLRRDEGLSSQQIEVWKEFQGNISKMDSLQLLKDLLAANEMGDGSYQANRGVVELFSFHIYSSPSPPVFYQHISQMLDENPSKRPTAAFLSELVPFSSCCIEGSSRLEVYKEDPNEE